MCLRRIVLVCAALVGLTATPKPLAAQETKSHFTSIEFGVNDHRRRFTRSKLGPLGRLPCLSRARWFRPRVRWHGPFEKLRAYFRHQPDDRSFSRHRHFPLWLRTGWGNLAGGVSPPGWAANFGDDLSTLNRGVGIGAESGPTGAPAYGLLGTKGFALSGLNNSATLSFFFFMAACLIIAASVPTGAMAERWAWRNFILYGFWVIVPLSIFAGWVWGGGWLAQMGKNWNLGHGAVDSPVRVCCMPSAASWGSQAQFAWAHVSENL